MFYFFRRKIIFEKWFRHFSVFDIRRKIIINRKIIFIWPKMLSKFRDGQISAVLARFRAKRSASGQSSQPEFRLNCLDFGNSSRNPVKVTGILLVNDKILSLMIFILFYINIYMLWIKIDFCKLIWLNENIKNIFDFPYVPITEKFQLRVIGI